MFAYLKKWRREKLLTETFPQDWETILRTNVWQYETLAANDQAKLRNCLRIFVAEKHWEGCAGLELTDEIRVTVAGQACLLLLGFDGFYFDHVETVLIYPGEFLARDQRFRPQDVGERIGEAHHRGPVVISWEDARAAGRRHGDGTNVVIHEFAHQLDMLEGEADGVPPVANPDQRRRWRAVIDREYDRLLRQSRRGRPTLLDDYGAHDEAEFFAVATETFFEAPVDFQSQYPRLYRLLADWYRQDPESRMRPIR
jgi:Mlc titration factor MtfA (ptsG expression regulator)